MTTPENQLVSVILCFYNEEEFLSEAVSSVIAQDYVNWELILVDDGSSDESTAIAKDFVRSFPTKIRYFHHPGHCNEGLSASRNLGIEKSRGQYVAFIDADDIWHADKVSYQVNIFNQHPEVTVAIEGSLYWYSWASQDKPDMLVPVGVREGVYSPPQLMLNLYPLGKGSAPCPSGIMVKRDVLDRCDFEDSFKGIYQMYEDQAFLCKVYLKEKVFVSALSHNQYRQRPTSIVSSVMSSGKYRTVRSYYLQWFGQYLRYHRFPFEKVKILWKRAIMEYENPLQYKLMFETKRYLKAVLAKALVRLGLISYS